MSRMGGSLDFFRFGERGGVEKEITSGFHFALLFSGSLSFFVTALLVTALFCLATSRT